MSFPYPKPFPGASYTAIAAVAAAALLSGETDGLAFDFTYDADVTKQMEVITSSVVVDSDPFASLTYTSPSIKMCRQSDGVWRYGNHNLGLQSQTLDNASWGTKYQSSISANATTAPDGTLTADKLVESVANDNHGLEQAITGVAGKVYQWSVYAKPAGRSWFGTGVNFDVTNGVIGTIAAGFSASITSVGNGWYRCVWSGPAATSAIGFSFYLATADSGPGFVYAGDGTSGIYFWGAEVKAYPVQEPSGLSGYIATTTAAKCGLPYEWNAAGVAQGLLIEEARTNLCLWSQDFTGTGWTSDECGATANSTTAPDGTTTADTLTPTATTTQHRRYRDITVTANSTYTLSCYVKAKELQAVSLAFWNTGVSSGIYTNRKLTDGTEDVGGSGAFGSATYTSSSCTDAGNGWWRVTVTGIMDAASTTMRILIIPYLLGDSDGNYAANGTDGIYAWGAQLELGSFPTSPIHTTSATVTRAVDDLKLATALIPVSTTVGTFFSEHACLRTETNSYHYPVAFEDDSGSDLEWAGLGYDNGERLFMDVYHNNANTGFIDTGQSLIQGQTRKFAGAWATNDFAASVDGAAAVTTNLGGGGAGPDEFSFLRMSGTGFYYKKVVYLPRRATNTELQTRAT